MKFALAMIAAWYISTLELGKFFTIPAWMPTSVPSSDTFGSCDNTNVTRRITPQTIAAVNACFEAYDERTYFAHAGQSNVWDEAVYGPRCEGSDKSNFRFSMPTNSPFVYDPDTNRVVKTRRFVEYDNIDRLANALMLPKFIGVKRPNWWDEVDTYSDYGIRWSSSLFDGIETNYGTLGDDFPAYTWMNPSSFLSMRSGSKWAGCAPYFRQATSGDTLLWGERFGDANLAWIAMEEVNFGENEFEYGIITDYMEPYPSFTNTADIIVGTGHDLYKPCVITNYVTGYDNIGDELIYDVSDYICSLPDISERSYESSFFVTDVRVIGCDGHQADLDETYKITVDGHEIVRHRYVSVLLPTESAISAFADRVVATAVGVTFNVADGGGWYYVESMIPEDAAQYITVSYRIGYVENSKKVVAHIVGVEGLSSNDTRRLVTDRLSGIGVTLGALDRTYARIKAPMPNVVTQYEGYAFKEYSANVEIEDVGEPYFDGEAWRTYEKADIDIPPLEVVSNGTRFTSVGSASVGGRYVKYATPMYHNISYSKVIESQDGAGNVPLSQSLINLLDSMIPGYDGENEFRIDIISVEVDEFGYPVMSYTLNRISGSTTNSTSVLTHHIDSLPSFPSNATVIVGAESHVSYRYGHTYGYPMWTHGYKSYPGDFSRINQQSKPKLWSVRGAAWLSGSQNSPIDIDDVLDEIEYSSSASSRFSSQYSSAKDEYSSASTMFAAFNGQYQGLATKCTERFNTILGVDPTSPADVLSAVSEGMTRKGTLSNLYLFGSYLVSELSSPTGIGGVEVIGISGTYQRPSETTRFAVPDTVYYSDGSTTSFADPVILKGWGLSVAGDLNVKDGHEPDNTDKYGLITNGKISPWSKVDWDWKALKRTKNRQ